MPEPALRWHEDPEAFEALLTLTAARAGFLVRLVEKDYFCSVLLEYLGARCPSLVFKGGTCLAKVHAEFHRLSEDLDFAIPVPVGAPRSERSRLAGEVKRAMAGLERGDSVFRTVSRLRGANNSTQYQAVVGYTSRAAREEETIKIEVGLREPLLTPQVRGHARTLLLDPASERPLVPELAVTCLSHAEAMAEKLRAAMTRREPAIRDYYDIDHAVSRRGFRVDDVSFLSLVRRKLEVPGTPAADLSSDRLADLETQLDSQLKPVLRPADFAAFDVARAIGIVAAAARGVSGTP